MEQKKTNKRELTLMEAVRLLIPKLPWILCCGLAAALLAGLATGFLNSPEYSSAVTMYIYTSRQENDGVITNSDLAAAESLTGTCKEILQSNTVLSLVCEQIGSGLTAEELKDMVRISAISDTQLLEIEVTAADPVVAQVAANAFAELGPARIIRVVKAGGVEIVDYAQLPSQPNRPHLAKNMMFALVFGLILSACFFLVRGIHDPVICTEADGEDLLGMTVLSTVREPPKSPNGHLLGTDSPEDMKESYARIRAGLILSAEGEGLILAVTCADATESKSLTAANIAVSFALLGKRTLLIDSDMRNPSQHRLWNMNYLQGLSELLAHTGNESIHDVDGLPLSVMPAGTGTANPSELVCAGGFGSMLASLREKYEYIVIDTPPVNQVSDALVIARQANGVLLTAHAGFTHSKAVEKAEKTLQRSGCKITGIVIDGVKRGHAHENSGR